MKMLLAAIMLVVLAGCAVYYPGYYPPHRGDGWYSHGNDDDD